MKRNDVLDLLKEVLITATIEKDGSFGGIDEINSKLIGAYNSRTTIRLVCIAKNQQKIDEIKEETLKECGNLFEYSDDYYTSEDDAFRVIKVLNYEELEKQLVAFHRKRLRDVAFRDDTLKAIENSVDLDIENDFIGFSDQIQYVEGWIKENEEKPDNDKRRYLTYVCESGSGKTTFARKIVEQARANPQEYGNTRPVYYFVQGSTRQDVFDVAKNFARQLSGYYPELTFNENRFSKNEFQRILKQVSDSLENQNRIQLMVLDGADQLESSWFEFCNELPPRILCLVTIRSDEKNKSQTDIGAYGIQPFQTLSQAIKNACAFVDRFQDDIEKYLNIEILKQWLQFSKEPPLLGVLSSCLKTLKLIEKDYNDPKRLLRSYEDKKDYNDSKWWLRRYKDVVEGDYKSYIARAENSNIPQEYALEFLGYCALVHSMTIPTLVRLITVVAMNEKEDSLKKDYVKLCEHARSLFECARSLFFKKGASENDPITFPHPRYYEYVTTKLRSTSEKLKDTPHKLEDTSKKNEDRLLYDSICETLIKGCRRCCRLAIKKNKINATIKYALKHRILHLLDLDVTKKRSQIILIRTLTDVGYFEKRVETLRNVNFIQDIEKVERTLPSKSSINKVKRNLQSWISFLKRLDSFLLRYPYALAQEVVNEFEGDYEGNLGKNFKKSLINNVNKALNARVWLKKLWGNSSVDARTKRIQWSSDDKFFITVNRNRTVKWNPKGEEITSFSYDNLQSGQFDVTSDGKTLVVVKEEIEGYRIRVWDLETETENPNPKKYPFPNLEKIYCSPDGSHLVLIHSDTVKDKDKDDKIVRLWIVRLWNVKTCEMIFENCYKHSSKITGLAFSPDGSLFVTGDSSGKICVWNLLQKELVGTNGTLLHQIEKFTFSTDNKTFASGHKDGSIYLWNVDNIENAILKPEFISQKHNVPITNLMFSQNRNGKCLVSNDEKGIIKIWSYDLQEIYDVRYNDIVVQETGVPNGILTPLSDELFISGDSWGEIYLWSSNGQKIKKIGTHQAPICSLECKSKKTGELYDSSFVSQDNEGIVCLWLEENGKFVPKELITKVNSIPLLVFSSNQNLFATYNKENQTINIYTSTDGICKNQWKINDKYVKSLSFSSDETSLIVVGENREQRKYNIFDEIPEGKIIEHTDTSDKSASSSLLEGSTCHRYSKDNTLLLTGNAEGNVRLFETDTRKKKSQFDFERPIKTLSFDNHFSVQLNDGEVIKKDVDTGQEIRRYRLFEGNILKWGLNNVLLTPIAPIRIDNDIQQVNRFQVSDGTIRYVVLDANNNYYLYKLNEVGSVIPTTTTLNK